jgi:hypothetical protein
MAPDEIRAKLSELKATRDGRRDARVSELRARYGAATEDPAFRAELRVHARRMAFLHRAQLVAATELAEPKRSRTLARISGLTAKEQRRHGSRMEALSARNPEAALAAASASAGPPTTGTAAAVAAPKASIH